SETGHNVTQTFFAQHQLEALHLDHEILQELQAFAPKHTETELRSILGCFLFTGDDAFKKIRVLSGGEKSRVALAKALTADANFLVLDEPTNHLDIQSVNILIQALRQFEGTFIVVSHDRYLLDNVAKKIWYIEDRKLKENPGHYQEVEEWQAKRTLTAAPQKAAIKPLKQHTPAQAASPKSEDRDRQNKKLQKELEGVEQRIAYIEQTIKETEALMAQETIYTNPEKLKEASRHYETLKKELLELQQQWEKLAEEIIVSD